MKAYVSCISLGCEKEDSFFGPHFVVHLFVYSKSYLLKIQLVMNYILRFASRLYS